MKVSSMDVMRYTVVDERGAVSFVAACDVCTAMVAACSEDPKDLSDLLDKVDFYYRNLKEYVLNGLAVFDERNTKREYAAIHVELNKNQPQQHPVFRVVDEMTRETSLRPVMAGAIIFNLHAKRIVQLDNRFEEIARSGKVTVFDGFSRTNLTYLYHLPKAWKLVP